MHCRKPHYSELQCRHLIPALYAWAARAYYTTARSIATPFLGHDLSTIVALIRMPCGSLVCLAYYSNMLSLVVCTTRHCLTSGQLVQELDACTVQMYRLWHEVCESELFNDFPRALKY